MIFRVSNQITPPFFDLGDPYLATFYELVSLIRFMQTTINNAEGNADLLACFVPCGIHFLLCRELSRPIGLLCSLHSSKRITDLVYIEKLQYFANLES